MPVGSVSACPAGVVSALTGAGTEARATTGKAMLRDNVRPPVVVMLIVTVYVVSAWPPVSHNTARGPSAEAQARVTSPGLPGLP